MTTSLEVRRERRARITAAAGLAIDAGVAPPNPAEKKKRKPKTSEQDQKELFSEAKREELNRVARSGGFKAVRARIRLDNDARRREERTFRAELPQQFDVPTLARTNQGFAGRGGGRMPFVRRPTEFRGTTAQIPGMYPFSVGASAPFSGAPIGTHLETGQPVGFGTISWFLDKQMTAPSKITLGLNGMGKSTFERRGVLWDMASGVRPMIMGDIRPDFAPMFHRINELSRDEMRRRLPQRFDPERFPDGPLQISEVGIGGGKLNPLEAGGFGRLIKRLPGDARARAEVELRRRQVTALMSLLEILRGSPFEAHEETLVGTALDVLYETSNDFTLDEPPLPEDVLRILKQAPQTLLSKESGNSRLLDIVDASGAMGRTDELTWDRYAALTERLRQALDLIVRGSFGSMFNARTTNRIDTGALGVCVDISKVPHGDTKLRGAVMMTTWSDGFSAVEAAHILSDHGIEPPQLFNMYVDEFSLVLGLGPNMVYRMDEVVRVQREIGTGSNFTTHTIKDLSAFDSLEHRQRALGFFDRARAKVFFPIPESEVELLEGMVHINDTERRNLAEWASAPRRADDPVVMPYSLEEWDEVQDGSLESAWAAGIPRKAGGLRIPPGMGKAIIKVGEGDQPGIPLQTVVPPIDRRYGFHNTNRRFEQASGRNMEGNAA